MKFLFFLVLFATLTTKNNAQNGNSIDDYPTVKAALNKKIWSPNKNYYTITKATDSTVHLFWGNNTLKRKLNEDLALWPAAERLSIKWSNKDYLILEFGTGSGAWLNIVLPIDKKEKPQEFDNGVCFDNVSNLFAYESYDDTILIVQNLKTRKEQYIVEKKRCCVANNSECINSAEIKNRLLYFKWAPDNCANDKKIIYHKKVKLKI